jgi:hypothetical protein
MATPSPTLPPVTGRFEYRPVTPEALVASRSKWDAVWMTPTDATLDGRRLVASVVDSWYPAHFIRAIRAHIGGRRPVEQPAPTTMVAATVAFTAPADAYDGIGVVLLANQVTAVAEGHFFERSEIWSVQGQLLATADLIRRNEHPEAE